MPPHKKGQQGNSFAFFAACSSGPAPAKLPCRNRQMEDSTQPRTTIIPITLRANQRLELVMPDGPLKAWRADVSMCSRNVLQSAWGGRMTNAIPRTVPRVPSTCGSRAHSASCKKRWLPLRFLNAADPSVHNIVDGMGISIMIHCD